MFPINFIHAESDYSTLEKWVPAPYFRRTFQVREGLKIAKIVICGLGFYELHINGENVTKGYLAPYRSNHDHYIYFDQYDITQKLQLGKNVAAMVLGNGMQNPLGGYIWELDKAPWRSSPQVSYEISLEYEDGKTVQILSDENTKTKSSPIVFNDLHWGEYYDARLETEGWDEIELDDTEWENAKPVSAPRGEPRIADVEPLVVRNELLPLSITECDGGYIYDFGVNTAGLCRLTIEGKKGQKILLQYFEALVDGKPHFDNFRYGYGGFVDRFQEDEYYCSGKGTEIYTPHFTYHGFRYVYVSGITAEQATRSLLICLEISSDIRANGSFQCSDEMANEIQEATVRSDYSNFYYFPTDCPQREKAGWTADAAISVEQMLLNLAPERSLHEWMKNVYKALNEHGTIPGIVPTAGWGYEWGNGPAWDSVLVYVPYYVYKYRGNKKMLEDCAIPLMRYLTHLYASLDEKDLMEIGLGDYCQAKRLGSDCDTPLIVTDTIMTAEIARKAEFIYDVLGLAEQKAYATALRERVTKAFRKHLIDAETLEIRGDTQTCYAMALYYGMVMEEEREKVFTHLLEAIEREEGHIGTGVLGGKVIFRVLSENGRSDLAYNMITRPDFPSYGNWIVRGATTLWESFFAEDGGRMQSLNHHFWGDVSAWFYYYPGGLRFNPTGKDITHVDIKPHFIDALVNAEVSHQAPDGEIRISWKRTEGNIILEIKVPDIMCGKIELPMGYVFIDNVSVTDLKSGVFEIYALNSLH